MTRRAEASPGHSATLSRHRRDRDAPRRDPDAPRRDHHPTDPDAIDP